MKKTLLLSALSLACLSQVDAIAQKINVVDGVTIWTNSPNGRWACSSTEGTAYFWDTQTTVPMMYNDQPYAVDGINNDGWAAGSIGEPGAEKPILLSPDCEVKMLPIPEGSEMVYGSARNLTEDGQMVCGFLQPNVNAFDNVISAYPYIWEISGDNITATPLPYPEKDFTGRAPQGNYPLFISADKNRIIGRQIDFSGSAGVPIIWEKDSEGKWTYRTFGEDIVFKDGAEFPEWPDVEPKEPEAGNYMTEEELNAYQAAYDEWVASGYVGEMPAYEDYINDAEKKAQYLADKAAYEEAKYEYDVKVTVFLDIFFSRLSGTVFDLYSISASNNGRYMGFTVKASNEETMERTYNPAILDLNTNEFKVLDGGGNACMANRITDNGDVVYRIPYSGTQYDPVDARIIMNGSSTSLTIPEYLSLRTNGKVNEQTFIDAGLSYTYTDYTTGEPVEVTDKILTGTANVSANGLAFIGFGSDPNTFALKSWAIDATEFASVNSVKTDNERIIRTNLISDGKVEFLSEVESATLYGLDGSMRMSVNNPGSEMSMPNEKGVYILRSVTTDGTQHVDKIVLQ